MKKEINYPIIIFEEIDNFLKTYKTDDKKSFEIKIDSLFENLKFKTKNFEKKEIEVTGKDLITYSLSQIGCNPNEYNNKNIAVKLKSKIQSGNISELKLLWDFLFVIDDSFDVNQKFIFSEKEKNRTVNEYDLISFRDDVIYYICYTIVNKKEKIQLLTLIIYAYLRIVKNQYSKNFFIFILSLCIFKENFEFQSFVELLLRGINEKNEKYLCETINNILEEKGIQDKKVEKINYSLKGIKTIKKMFIDLIDKDIKNNK